MKIKFTKSIIASLAVALVIPFAIVGVPYYKSSYVPAAQLSFPNNKSYFNVPIAYDISPDDKYIACVNTRRKLRIWTTEGVHLATTYTLPHYAGENSLSWLPNGRDLEVDDGAYMQTCVGMLTHSRRYVVQHRIGFGPPVSSPRQFKISPSGMFVAAQYLNCALQLWNAQTNKTASLPRPSGLPPLSRYDLAGIGFSPDSSTMAAVYATTCDNPDGSGGSAECRTFETVTGKPKYTWQWKPECRLSDGIDGVKVAVSHDGKYVAIATNINSPGNSDGAIVWDAATGRKLCSLDIETPWTQVSFIPGSSYIASADPGQIAIWNYRTGAFIHSFHDRGTTQSFTVSRDGHYIASMYLDTDESTQAIDLWDLKRSL